MPTIEVGNRKTFLLCCITIVHNRRSGVIKRGIVLWCDWHGQYLAGGIPVTALGIGTCRRKARVSEESNTHIDIIKPLCYPIFKRWNWNFHNGNGHQNTSTAL